MGLSEGLELTKCTHAVLVCINLHESWRLSAEVIAQAVIDVYRYAGPALISQIEIRPSPPRQAVASG
jgi:hypothetical protein